MHYNYLACTGVRVSELCLGTMTFGNEADEAMSQRLMDRAYERGINFLDTADVYNNGLSEEILGRWMGEKRRRIVLATKAYFPTGDDVNDRGGSFRHIVLTVEASLRRLQTDWIDILYLHLWDDHTAIEETLRAVDLLVRQGKVLYFGVSNFAAWQTIKAMAAAREKGFTPVTAVQPMYNLLKRQAEVEILPMAASEGLAVCPYNPLAAGVLTGKYLEGQSGRLDEIEVYKERYSGDGTSAVTERFVTHARERGESPAALAAAWVKSHPAVTSAIIGARNLEQLNDTLAAADIELSAQEREVISDLSPAPPPATDRTEKRNRFS